MSSKLDAVLSRLHVEVAKLLRVLLRLCDAHLLHNALAMHTHELELKPLPAAEVVVPDHEHRHRHQNETRQGEYQIQPANRVIVRNRLLWLHESGMRDQG